MRFTWHWPQAAFSCSVLEMFCEGSWTVSEDDHMSVNGFEEMLVVIPNVFLTVNKSHLNTINLNMQTNIDCASKDWHDYPSVTLTKTSNALVQHWTWWATTWAVINCSVIIKVIHSKTTPLCGTGLYVFPLQRPLWAISIYLSIHMCNLFLKSMNSIQTSGIGAECHTQGGEIRKYWKML